MPIVGAGISTDSGFPILTSIVRYFGKLHQYIHRNAYLLPEKEISDQRLVKAFTKKPEINQLACQAADLLAAIDRDYKKAPWTYIQDFGWPDRFQLNQELFARLELLEAKYHSAAKASQGKIKPRELVAFAVRVGLDEML